MIDTADTKDGAASSKWRYDGTITLGHLLIMLGIVTSGIGLYTSTVVKLSSHDARITALEKLSEAQGQYNKSAIEILTELKQLSAITDAITKDRDSRNIYRQDQMRVPQELKGKQ